MKSRLTLALCSFLAGSFLAASSFAVAADWPQWRGAKRDGMSADTGLLKEWPEGGPKVAWQIEGIGEGYASLAVADGRVYTQGNVDGKGMIFCLSEKDGSVVWSVRPPTEDREYKHGKGNGGRGTPTVDGDLVFTIGGGGDLTCLKTDDGEVVWSKHLVSDFGGSRPGWGYSESPLIDGDHLIVTPGGDQGCVVALNKKTGETVWASTGVTDKAHYCSATVVESHGVRQIVTFTGGSGNKRNPGAKPRVVGLTADTGELLWSYDKSANRTANVSTPLFANDQVFSASAYGTGGGLAKITRDGDAFTAEPAYFESKMQNHHGGMILIDGFIYGTGSNSLICMNFETGEVTWQARGAGKGSIAYADGHLYCYGEKNVVALVEVNSKEYVEKGQFTVDKKDYPTWAHPVVANGKFYLRDMNTLTAYSVAE
ncbi:MAG: PQQ-binding-like beta-propeller repeat protein [Planctomycetota bacterium]|nr:PQQ-binding-like beta-propeller repeat protein [Planctomycetota bacterium]MDA1252702.1 PQQ-binding-like beta-propeller repeat protein [Planctomycetota bacterium]